MSYPIPQSQFHQLVSISCDSDRARILNKAGCALEIEYIGDLGWLLETRYDEKWKDFRRQPWTCGQEKFARRSLEVAGEPRFQIKAGAAELRASREGHFEFLEHGKPKFELGAPFAGHEEPVSIYENLMSLKVTDFSTRSPTSQAGEKFETNMIRFSYPRPSGLVLGLPGQTGEINRNGYRFELYNTDTFVHTPGRSPLYQSWPILFHQISSGGWVGVFHDNPARTFVDVGDFDPSQITFESITGNSRVFLTFGESLSEVSRKMIAFLGSSALPPLWAFGYQQCRWSYMSSGEILDVVSKFESNSVPLDAIYFDIDYMDAFKVFTVNQERFPDLKGLIGTLHKKDVHAVCIVDPGVKVESDYSVYETIRLEGDYLKQSDGSEFIGTVWPGKSLFPDFFSGRTRSLWEKFQSDWLKEYPFDGIWNDMNEPSNFDGANKKTRTAQTVRGPLDAVYNLYGFQMAKASVAGWEKANPHKRGIVISRSGYPGLQQKSVIWHGDNMAWWEHLRLALDTCIIYSLVGANYTGADVPGFTGNPPDDLAVRFFQLGSVLPMFRGHSIYFAKDKEPYAFGESVSAIIRDTINLRYSLLREWYSGFERCVREKKSAMSPVLSGDSLVRDEFLLFEKFLVAPVVERDQLRKLIYLPPGTWFRLGDTKNSIQGDQWTSVPVTLDTLPIYVRGGSVITRNTPKRNVRETLAQPERVEVYADKGAPAEGYWYSDDGISVTPEKASRQVITADGQGALRRIEG